MSKLANLLILSFLFSLSSCMEESIENVIVEKNSEELVDPLEKLKIDSKKQHLSEEDAKNVALLFTKQSGTITKSLEDKSISAVITCTDAEKTPLLYISNFNDDAGFVIVSATKNYYPILAYSDEGNFTVDTSSMAGLWIKAMEKEISWRIKNDDTTCTPHWSAYETGDNNIVTRSIIPDYQNIMWWRDELIHDIKYTNKYPPRRIGDYHEYGDFDGDSFCNMDEARGIFGSTAEILNSLSSQLSNLGYDPNVILFHIKNFSERIEQAPLLSTYWDQDSPYNRNCPDNSVAGCVPVAIGQILNYHRWPTHYITWSQMNSDPDAGAARLLGKIGAQIGMVYGSEESYPRFWDPLDFSDLSHAKKFFRENQYTVSKDSPYGKFHIVSQSILNGNPVYMEGTQELFSFLGIRIPSFTAHAWVCDGYTSFTISNVFVDAYYPTRPNPGDNVPLEWNPYERDYSTSLNMYNGYAWKYFHMNWGWGIRSEYNSNDGSRSKNNGWFLNGDISQLDGVDYTVLYRYVTAIPNR